VVRARAGWPGRSSCWDGARLRRGSVKVIAAGVALLLPAAFLSAPDMAGASPVSVPAVVPAASGSCAAGGGVLPGVGGELLPVSAGGTVVPDFQEVVGPGEPVSHVVAFRGARLVVPRGAVTGPVSIGVSELVGSALPRLASGMSNVTGGGAWGVSVYASSDAVRS
jgi:hypothetical protein